jgi:hypothetical protein
MGDVFGDGFGGDSFLSVELLTLKYAPIIMAILYKFSTSYFVITTPILNLVLVEIDPLWIATTLVLSWSS